MNAPQVPPPGKIDRGQLLARLREREPWDVLIIGGGATGLGLAVDAAARGFRTALVEARDFSSGTSSRSTKLIHGGVRYLAQGNVKLVREALVERALLLANAPAIVRPLEFIVPCYRPLEREFMRIGLGLYDALAGSRGIGPTQWLSRAETLARLPGVRARGLRGGVSYWDAQFDDARLAIALMRTAIGLGAVAVNYVGVERIAPGNGRIERVEAVDAETGERFCLRARVVFNAAGVWVDRVRRLADPDARPLITISRGSHIVVPHALLPASAALMIPRTRDGRVLFAIPWLGRLIVGTTDVPAEGPDWEPRPSDAEVGFILDTARGYLERPIGREDITATFAGLRPLFSPRAHGATKTISREHAIVIEHGNLVTVTGGKWTTYRRMALDALNRAAGKGLLPARSCVTATLRLAVVPELQMAFAKAMDDARFEESGALARYAVIARDFELARSAEDVLSRRLRLAPLDEQLALRCKEQVARAVGNSG